MADKLDGSMKGLTPKTFHTLYRDMATDLDALQTKGADYRNACKRMEKAGCDMKALQLALQVKKMEDTAQVSFMESFLRIAKWLQLGIVKQQDMFLKVNEIEDAAPDDIEKTEEVAAEMEGYNHGSKGGNKQDCPYAVGSSKQAAWMRGCHRGTDESTVDTSKPHAKPASRARKRPTADTVKSVGDALAEAVH